MSRKGPIPGHSHRGDATLYPPTGTGQIIVDVASLTPFHQDDTRATSKRLRDGRPAVVRGNAVEKAIANEEVKKSSKSGADCAAAGIEFVPLVFSSFGGWGRAASDVIAPIAHRLHRKFDVHPTKARLIVGLALQIPMMQRIAWSGRK